MSNLLKSFSVVCSSGDKRVIDSNSQITRKMQEINNTGENQGGFVQGLDVADANAGFENISASGQTAHGEAHGEIVQSETYSEGNDRVSEKYEEIHREADNLLATAQSDAKAIVEKAVREAQNIMEQAKKEGYEEGLKQGMTAADRELDARLKEFDKKKNQLEGEYRQAKADMEPQLVNSILDVVLDVTHILADNKKDMILEIVNGVMSDNIISRNFLIRASREDAVFLRDNKDKIIGMSNKDINIEIVTDDLMKRNECMIETDFGVFDCSLDVQLENLARDIRLLSCAAGND